MANIDTNDSLVNFIDMLVNRLSNLENKFDNLIAVQEHEDNLKGAIYLSGMRHCDPPRQCIIHKHYSDYFGNINRGFVFVETDTTDLPFDHWDFDEQQKQWVINPTRVNDLKLVFGDKFNLLEKSIYNFPIPTDPEDHDDFPPYDQFPSEYKLFNRNYSSVWSEIMDRFVRKKFTNIHAIGDCGFLISKDTVRNIMKTIDSVYEYFHAPKPININLYDVGLHEKRIALAEVHEKDVKAIFDTLPDFQKQIILNHKEDEHSFYRFVWCSIMNNM